MHFREQHQSEPRAVRLIQEAGVRNIAVFSVIVLSALLVVSARMVAPFQVGKDQASQLEAAENLAQGRGLTTTAVRPSSFDITVTPEPKYLTWWPPGFSLMVALFLRFGFSLLLSLKAIYGVVTLVGWIGWALLVSQRVAGPLRIGAREYPIHLVIAALLPVFFTISWDGTDIFLWAGIPFIFVWLFRQGGAQASYKTVVAAGLLFGTLCAIRHASLFLSISGFLILFQVRFPDYKDALKRFAIYQLTALILIAPTYLYLKLYATGISGIADQASLTTIKTNLVMLIDWVLHTMPVAFSMILGFPMLDQVLYKLNLTWLLRLSGLICGAMLLLMPILLIRIRKGEGKRLQSDMALGLTLLLLSLPMFLAALDFLTGIGLLGVRRYYESLSFCGLLILYELAAARSMQGILTYAARVVVLAFMINVCVYLPAQAFMPERSGFVVKTVLGFVPSNNVKYSGTSYKLSYPSFTMFSRKESSRQKIRELGEANPGALFFVEEYAYFVYDGFPVGGPTPGKTVRVFSESDYWRNAYTSLPVKVFWVVDEATELDFVPSAHQQLVFSDPVERTKIVAAEFPAGHRFIGDESSVLVAPNNSLDLAVSRKVN